MKYLLKFAAVLIAISTSACTQEHVDLTKEGDLVLWKQNPSLIIKARLGQRREHIPDSLDKHFYRPEREHFVGQFPINYIPEQFPKISQAEADALPMPYSNHQLEFSLMLDGIKSKVTDKSVYAGSPLDHQSQVRVTVHGLTLHMRREKLTSSSSYQNLVESGGRNGVVFIPDTKSKLYGLNCYYRGKEHIKQYCFGDSADPKVSGISISHYGNISPEGTSELIRGENIGPELGGIWVRWYTDANNMKRWREIDAAVWSILKAWNVSPTVKQAY